MNRRMNIKRIRLIQRIILFLLVIIALLYICSLLYYSKEGFACNTRTDISKGVTTYLCDTQAEAEDKLTNGIPTNIISYDMCYNVNIDRMFQINMYVIIGLDQMYMMMLHHPIVPMII